MHRKAPWTCLNALDDQVGPQGDPDNGNEEKVQEEGVDASSTNSDEEEHLQTTGPAPVQVEPLPGLQEAEEAELPKRSEGRSHEAFYYRDQGGKVRTEPQAPGTDAKWIQDVVLQSGDAVRVLDLRDTFRLRLYPCPHPRAYDRAPRIPRAGGWLD